MKKVITFLLCLVYSCDVQLCASSFTIRVPKRFLTEKAALVLYMLDESGKPCVGKCRLDLNSASRKISQCELQMTTDQEMSCMCDAIDLKISNPSDPFAEHEVVLCFEFDKSVNVLRTLVVKDTLLEDDPFGVLEFSPSGQETSADDDEFDPLSDLVDGVDASSVATAAQAEANKNSLLTQCALYAEIVALVTYGKAKRAVNDMTTWIYGSN
ncbi:MAG: hypothetical protein NTZ68_02370 [Candidatus Dependentiae bacterium]|nr:hypothetical protein [Candidatus Dependentiae bacterium]